MITRQAILSENADLIPDGVYFVWKDGDWEAYSVVAGRPVASSSGAMLDAFVLAGDLRAVMCPDSLSDALRASSSGEPLARNEAEVEPEVERRVAAEVGREGDQIVVTRMIAADDDE